MSIKIIDGIAYEHQYVEGSYVVRTFARNGVMERSVRQLRVLREVETSQRYYPVPYEAPTAEQLARWEADAEEAREQARERAAAVAKTAARRIIIAEGFDELLTLTYRENQLDRALCKKHFKEWVRRMKTAIPGFRYCASFERQDRGAMHVHLATHKLPKHATWKGVKVEAWKLGTKIWRSIVGDDNGLCFVGGKSKRGRQGKRFMGLAKMAAYVSKYIMKDWQDVPKGEARYSHSRGEASAPRNLRPQYLELHGTTFADAIAVCFETGEGDIVCSWSINPLSESMWLVKQGPHGAPAS